MRLTVMQRRQRIGSFARLRNKYGKAIFIHRRIAISKLRSNINRGRNTRIAFNPITPDLRGEIGRAASHQNNAIDFAEIEIIFGQQNAARFGVNILTECARQHFRLLVNFFHHKMAIIAFIDHRRGGIDCLDLSLNRTVLAEGENLCAIAAHHRPIAIFQIANPIGKRREGKSVRAEIHLAITMPDSQRAAFARDNNLIFIAINNQGNRISTFQRRESSRRSLTNIVMPIEVLRE